MKTSNKLLLAFVIAALISPFILLFGFRKVFKEDKYTLENYQFGKAQRQALKPYKVVKIVQGGFTNFNDVFVCSIIPSNDAGFEIPDDFTGKGFSVKNSGDTLLIQNISSTKENGIVEINSIENLKMRLFLPDMSNIIVSGATILIDTVDAVKNHEINIHLTGQSKLELGRPDNDFSVMAYYYSRPYEPTSFLQDTFPVVKNLNIAGEDTRVAFGNTIRVNHLQLQLKNSKINIQPGVKIDTIQGQIDKGTVLNGGSGDLQKLLPLIQK